MSLVNLTSTNFEKEVIGSKKPVIIDAYAEWCGPCKLMAPLFEELSKEMNEYKFLKFNTDEDEKLAAMFGIMSIPTLLIFNNGKEVDRITGFMPKMMLKENIKKITKNL
ncbi:MAG: thioredoxin [Candidatus Woesearchaeota archaeon]